MVALSLQERAGLFDALFATPVVGIAVLDHQGIIRLVNDAGALLAQRDAASLIGRSADSFRTDLTAETTPPAPARVEVSLETPNGERRLEVTIIRLADGENSLLCVAHDITDRHLLQRRERTFLAALHGMVKAATVEAVVASALDAFAAELKTPFGMAYLWDRWGRPRRRAVQGLDASFAFREDRAHPFWSTVEASEGPLRVSGEERDALPPDILHAVEATGAECLLILPLRVHGKVISAMVLGCPAWSLLPSDEETWPQRVAEEIAAVLAARVTNEAAEAARRQLTQYKSELDEFVRVVSHDLSEPTRRIVALAEILQGMPLSNDARAVAGRIHGAAAALRDDVATYARIAPSRSRSLSSRR